MTPSTTISEEAWTHLKRLENLAGGTLIEADRKFSLNVAFARFIQEVSNAAKATVDQLSWSSHAHANADKILAPFILPEPADPLQEALREAYGAAAPEFVEATRAALAKRGLTIAKIGGDA